MVGVIIPYIDHPYFQAMVGGDICFFISNQPADEDGPEDGLIILGLLFFYPLFFLLLNPFSTFTNKE
jgi:hypothetical protein